MKNQKPSTCTFQSDTPRRNAKISIEISTPQPLTIKNFHPEKPAHGVNAAHIFFHGRILARINWGSQGSVCAAVSQPAHEGLKRGRGWARGGAGALYNLDAVTPPSPPTPRLSTPASGMTSVDVHAHAHAYQDRMCAPTRIHILCTSCTFRFDQDVRFGLEIFNVKRIRVKEQKLPSDRKLSFCQKNAIFFFSQLLSF